MAFVDFAELKAKVSFSQTIEVLGLQMKKTGNQWRGVCPTCAKGGDRALVITEGKGYYCFPACAGGDQIALVGHILEISVKDAAAQLAQAAGINTGTVHTSSTSKSKSTVPESVMGKETQKLQPLAYLQAEHPAVDAIGFSPEICAKLGIGYSPKGIMRGTVAVPIRDDLGNLLGYIGITDAKLPADFTSNVVSFPKTA
jgi:DNA primase